MGGFDQALSGLCRPAQPAELQHRHHRSDRPGAVREEGYEQEACPKARVAMRSYPPGCSQTSSGSYTCPEWCGMTPASSALKGKSILVMLESIISVTLVVPRMAYPLPLTVVAYLASPSPKPDVSKVQMVALGMADRVSKVRRSACNTRQQQRARPERPWAQNRGQNAASPTCEMVTKVTSLYSCAKTVSQCWRDIRTLPGPVEFIRSSPLPAELSPGQ